MYSFTNQSISHALIVLKEQKIFIPVHLSNWCIYIVFSGQTFINVVHLLRENTVERSNEMQWDILQPSLCLSCRNIAAEQCIITRGSFGIRVVFPVFLGYFGMFCMGRGLPPSFGQYRYENWPMSQPQLLFHKILRLREPLVCIVSFWYSPVGQAKDTLYSVKHPFLHLAPNWVKSRFVLVKALCETDDGSEEEELSLFASVV